MKKRLRCLTRSLICASVAVVLALTPMTASASSLKNTWPGASAPTIKNYTWSPVTEYTGIEKQDKYFVIKAKADGREEELFISLPAEGGIRLQSLHKEQKDEGNTVPE